MANQRRGEAVRTGTGRTGSGNAALERVIREQPAVYTIARWPDQSAHPTVFIRRGSDDHPLANGADEEHKPAEVDDTAQMSRWWLAGTVFPLMAATFGPIASTFSICALVRPWRQEIRPGTTIETAVFIDDPEWLVIVNAVQLAIAIIANVFLLLNMARRIRFSIAQPVTMVSWYISSLSLIALLATGAGHNGPLRTSLGAEKAQEMVWSQAFYYAIYSAVLYMVVASLMVVTFAGAWCGHYSKDFQLTNSQRTLMLQTILFLVYLLLGAFVFSRIEGWAFLDAVYWADVTLFTVGFGDFAASTTLGRALLFPYALIGVISLGLVIGSIRSLVLNRGKHRLDSRMAEKNRRQFLRHLSRKGDDSILRPDDMEDGNKRNGNNSRNSRNSNSSNGPAMAEFQRRESEFYMMRRIQLGAARRRRWSAVAFSGGTWLLLWLLGAYIFEICERPYQHWSYFDGFYLAFVSLTTIGYGDMTPISNAGKTFFVFWSLMALPTTTILISDAGDTIVKSISDATNAIGRITILPGERGLRRDAKELVRALTCGALFEDIDIEGMPPGLLGAAQESEQERAASLDAEEAQNEEEAAAAADEAEKEERAQRPERGNLRELARERRQRRRASSGHGHHGGHRHNPSRRPSAHPHGDSAASGGFYHLNHTASAMSVPRADLPQQLPGTRAEYLWVLADEIGRVTQHMRHLPPRKYSFREWAWFLCLMGEDENSTERHLRAPAQEIADARRRSRTTPSSTVIPASDAYDVAASSADSPSQTIDRPAWSWVGPLSPLMSGQEEAEWILDRLTQRLQAELQADMNRLPNDAASTASSIASAPIRRPPHPIQEESI